MPDKAVPQAEPFGRYEHGAQVRCAGGGADEQPAGMSVVGPELAIADALATNGCGPTTARPGNAADQFIEALGDHAGEIDGP